MGRRKLTKRQKELQERWEEKLSNLGLSMRRGENTRLSYGHDFNLAAGGGTKIKGGRRTPKLPNLGQIESKR